MMVFMVRGLFTKLQFAYAQFPCSKVSGDLLYDPFWEAVYRVERCGLKVRSNTVKFTHMPADPITVCFLDTDTLGDGCNLGWSPSQPKVYQAP